MLTIVVPESEYYNEETSTFVKNKSMTLTLEHSLISISKWESKWCKPFLGSEQKTDIETLDYIRCMVMTPNVETFDIERITEKNIKEIVEYIHAPMSATIINKQQDNRKKEVVTSELIYFYMITFNVPFECQKWHLNRLLMLINVCDFKNNPPKKMSKQEIYERNRALNAARRNQLNTGG